MKGLLVTESMFVRESGSKLMAESYYCCLCKIIGKENLDVVAIKNSWQKKDDRFICLDRKNDIFSFLCGYTVYLDRNVIKFILNKIDEGKYDFVFFTIQAFGKLVRLIKKKYPNIITITYYPGILRYISYYHPSIKEYVKRMNIIYNERICTKCCDAIILLNNREDENLYKYYKTHATDIIPIVMDDTFNSEWLSTESDIEILNSETFNLLFVGTYFPPNVYGIKWFIENVMPRLNNNIHLYIVGSDMEKMKTEFEYDENRIHIFGRVRSLSQYYRNADLVVEPIFHGDGMKTKTAEALMYGKTILGTREAFVGYSDLLDNQCDTAEKYIDMITHFYKNPEGKFSLKMREIYLKYYSMEAAVDKMTKLLERTVGEKDN